MNDFHISRNFLCDSVLRLSLASAGPSEGVNVNGRYVHLLSVAPAVGRSEVGQLEMRRDKVLRGMQDGARRYYFDLISFYFPLFASPFLSVFVP